MNKNDFRLQFPLWNACLVFLLMIFSYSVIYAIDMWNTEFTGLFREDGTFYIDKVALITCGISFLSLVVFYYFYLLKVRQYNKTNPTRKIKFFTFIHLLEFVDDDEMMQQVTNQATRKVYIFYSNMLPLLLLLLVFPLHRYFYVVAICGILITQNIIFYRHLSKYAEGISTTHAPLANKKIITTTFVALFILAITCFGLFYKLEQDQQEDSQIIENCINKGGTIYFHQTIFNSISCEQK